MRNMSRAIALFLCVVAVVVMMPSSAFAVAAERNEGPKITSGTSDVTYTWVGGERWREISIYAETADIQVYFNGNTTHIYDIPAGTVRNLRIRCSSVTFDRTVATTIWPSWTTE